jgi:hypothetical protein
MSIVSDHGLAGEKADKRNFFQDHKYGVIFGCIAAIVSLYLLGYTILYYPYDLSYYLFSNVIIVFIFASVGSCFDFNKHKIGFVLSGVLLAVLPFFSDSTSSVVDINPYAAPWLLMFLLPDNFQQGHPPAAIFVMPLFWVGLGVVLAIWHHSRIN